MKRQLDRLKGKRLVTGDPNLMTKNEICINATPNGVEVKEIGTDGKIKDLAGGGDSGSSGVEYWKIHVQWPYGDIIGALYKNVTSDGVIIQKYPDEDGTRIKAIVFIPTYIEHDNFATLYVSFKDVVKAMIGGVVSPEFETQFNSLFTPITKEEFYDLNNV